jgi:glycosyltransferase involved in cell wall biosynthesis
MADPARDDDGAGSEINSLDYWNKRFSEDWVAQGGRRQTEFFAELCCRELPDWLVDEVRARKSSIFDYGCALGDALPIWQRAFPDSTIRGGDIAEVGLGMARTLHPGFEFVDVSAIGESTRLADLVFCSNTLEHFENWQEVLLRLARQAEAYVVVAVPFEEDDRIEEHVCTFEFDSLPARLPGGVRLLHLSVVDGRLEPDSQWNGHQLIAIYGRKRRDRAGQPLVRPISRRAKEPLAFDLRGVRASAVPRLLVSLAGMSQHKRQIARELVAAEARAAATWARLEEVQLQAAQRIGALESDRAALHWGLQEYADLTRGMEDAQRWVIGVLSDLDPALLTTRQIVPVPEGWPTDLPDDVAIHRATLARLIEAVHRANRVALAFHDQASRWRPERIDLKRQQQETRGALEKAIGERDRARGRALAWEKIADASRTGQSAALIAANRAAAPLVSIVLPVYNQAYLVDEAIAGILSQTYENWELIVLDDGSTDDLESRVRQYLGERRVLFLRQPNQRLPAALNHGFAYARGDLLTWTSADNIMLPTQLERLVAELAAYPDAGLVYSDYWAIDDRGQPLDDPGWRSHNRDPEIADLIRLPAAATIENFHRSGDNFIGPSFLYRREVAAIVGRYADDAFGGEDYDFWLRMHLVTEFRHVAEPLYKYRVHRDTLTSRAEDLGLFANIQDLLEADRWRIETLLTNGSLASDGFLLRPASQFHAAVLQRCRPVAYREFVERDPAAAGEGPVVVDIDVPVRAIDRAALSPAEILLCRSELTASLLRREDWARDKRVLTWDGELTPAVLHAFIQAFADQVTTPVTAPVRRVPARIDEPFRPARILILVDCWSSGGLENVVIDLAESLAATGRSVVVAVANGAPPPAATFRNAPIRTVSLRGEESLFETLLRREAIEVVNYHHSCFAARRAREHGVATVYTMHNCYLWMDDRARTQVAGGLAEMDWLIAVSRQVAQFGAAQFGFPADRMVVIPNGLREEIIVTPTRSAVDSGATFTVAMVASLTPPKLQHVAIAAFAEVAQDIPMMRLRLIGVPLDRFYHQQLEAQIAASPHGHRIELIAGLTRAETIAALADAHVFLHPSLVEGCSMALLEAAEAGCVCIASDVGSARDLYVASGSVILLASPLGELESVTQQQFYEAAASEQPQHRANVTEALRHVWRDYGSFAAGTADTRARLRDLSGMQQMTDAYLFAYAMARRGGPSRRRLEPPALLSPGSVDAEFFAPA